MAMRLKGVVIVPSAGSSRRAGEIPALERVANRPILCHALERLSQAGIGPLAVIGPAPLLQCVEDAMRAGLPTDLTVKVLPQQERLGVLGALAAAAHFAGDDPALVHLADGLMSQPLDQMVDLRTRRASDLLLWLHHSSDSYAGLSCTLQALLGVSDLTGSPQRLTLAGASLFGPGTIRLAAELAGELQPEAGFDDLVQQLTEGGCKLGAGIVRGWRRYRGEPVDLLELNRIVLDQQSPPIDASDRGDNTIEGRVVIDPSAEVTSSVVLGPCIIGPDARVRNSYIGPYTSIGARADIEGAEIVRSIVSEGASIKHIGGRIEGSTIGRRASIFRDFGLPRAMRLHVGEGVEVALN